MMKVGYLITARLKSTRLPEKLLREVCGRPIFAHMLERLRLARRVDQIIVCTSTNPQDDRLVELVKAEGVACFRGHEEDVVRRLSDAADAFGLDYALNITADCPFADPVYADRIVEAYERTGADLIRAFDLPHGAFSYGLKPAALRQIIEIKADEHTEVWGRYFTDTDLFRVYDLPVENPLHRQPGLRMTLDYPEDLEFFRQVFAHLYRPGQVFSLDEILTFLQERPDIVDINRHCATSFKRRFDAQSEIALKPRHEVRRAAIIGCGSIGQRHIRNLRSLGIDDIVALRTRRGHAQDLDPALHVREVETWEECLDTQPDVAVVSNPTSLHLEAANRLLPCVRGLFVEKPLAPSLDRVPEFLEQLRAFRVISFVGHNLPFHPAIRAVQRRLGDDRLGKPLLFQAQVGQWLPDWHPYEDYCQAYYARQDLGGGAARTLIHEVHLAQELLGPAHQVACFLPHSSLLPLEVDVIADLMIQHTNGAVSQLHLDFVQRPLHRQGVISCERGWIQYDLVHCKVMAVYEDSPSAQTIWEASGYDANQMYLEEMSTFLRYVRQGRVRHAFDAWRATPSVAAVEAAFEAARSGCTAAIPAWVDRLV